MVLCHIINELIMHGSVPRLRASKMERKMDDKEENESKNIKWKNGEYRQMKEKKETNGKKEVNVEETGIIIEAEGLYGR